jgi:hypothetical protein
VVQAVAGSNPVAHPKEGRAVVAHALPSRRERHDAGRTTSRRQLQCDVAAERVADEMREVKACRIHRSFHRIYERRGADREIKRWASRVAGEREGENIVLAFQHLEHQLPSAPRVQEAV